MYAAIQSMRNPAPKSGQSKQSIRINTWRKIKNSRIGIGFIFNRNPSFVGIEKAAAKLCASVEYGMARHVKVGGDRVLYDLMLMIMQSGKTLYVNALRESSSLYNRVEMPLDVPDDVKREVLGARIAMHNYLTPIDIENRTPIDMVVIASLVVSRQGQRIGRGRGNTDMEIGLLIALGVVTPATCIVTIVHDRQVVDKLPDDVFKKYDVPIDMIITPTQVIRVTDGPSRPTGIYWDLVSQLYLRSYAALERYKTLQETAEGKTIVLRNLREKSDSGGGGDDPITDRSSPIRQQKRRRRYRNKRRRSDNKPANRPTAGSSDESLPLPSKPHALRVKSVAMQCNDIKSSRPRRRSRPLRDFCVKLTNLTSEVRIKDVKSELRRRNCNPFSILWFGRLGKCFLHFGNRNGQPSSQDDIDKVMEAMHGLSLTIKNDEPDADSHNGAARIKVINVSVELMKHKLNEEAPPVVLNGEQEAVNQSNKVEDDVKEN